MPKTIQDIKDAIAAQAQAIQDLETSQAGGVFVEQSDLDAIHDGITANTTTISAIAGRPPTGTSTTTDPTGSGTTIAPAGTGAVTGTTGDGSTTTGATDGSTAAPPASTDGAGAATNQGTNGQP